MLISSQEVERDDIVEFWSLSVDSARIWSSTSFMEHHQDAIDEQLQLQRCEAKTTFGWCW